MRIRGLWPLRVGIALSLAYVVFRLVLDVAPVEGQGGEGTVTFTTSTTQGATFIRVDLPTIQAYQTQVVGVLGGAEIYEDIVGAPPSALEVVSLLEAAHAALHQAGACSISDPMFMVGAASSNTVYLGEQLNRIEETVTTTLTIGPGIVLIGPDQSEVFYVAEGTHNFNTNTHAQHFWDQLYQATVTNHATYSLTGSACLQPLIRPAPTVGAIGMLALVAALIVAARQRPRRRLSGT